MAITPEQNQAANLRALRKAVEALGGVLDGIGIGAKEGLADVGVEIVNNVRSLLSQPGAGRLYRVPFTSKFHRASKPGAPPATDTGRLRSSYTFVQGTNRGNPFVDVGTNVEAGALLEIGTRNIRPRPHLRPAVSTLGGGITDLIARGIIREQQQEVARLPREIKP